MSNEISLVSDEKTEQKQAEKIDWNNYKSNAEKTTSELDNLLKSYTHKTVIDNSLEDQQNSEVNTDKPKRRGRRKKIEPVIISGELLTGAMFLTLIDMLFPMIIATINNTIDKKKQVSAQSLKITQTQKNELEPIADAVMKEIQIKANPVYILIASMLSIYGMNFLKAKYE